MEGVVGKCFANCEELMPKVMDDHSVKRLWNLSESMLGYQVSVRDLGSRQSSRDDPRDCLGFHWNWDQWAKLPMFLINLGVGVCICERCANIVWMECEWDWRCACREC